MRNLSIEKIKSTKYGRLTVIKEVEPFTNDKQTKRQMLCECDCGTRMIYYLSNLRNGHTKSCGCLRDEFKRTHGLRKTKLYRLWTSLKERCYSTNAPSYKYYGAKGVTMWSEWKDNVVAFSNWAESNGYTSEAILKRIDKSKGYQPDNCKFLK